MRVGILGLLPVVGDDGPVDIGGTRLRTMLIRLALEPGRTPARAVVLSKR